MPKLMVAVSAIDAMDLNFVTTTAMSTPNLRLDGVVSAVEGGEFAAELAKLTQAPEVQAVVEVSCVEPSRVVSPETAPLFTTKDVTQAVPTATETVVVESPSAIEGTKPLATETFVFQAPPQGPTASVTTRPVEPNEVLPSATPSPTAEIPTEPDGPQLPEANRKVSRALDPVLSTEVPAGAPSGRKARRTQETSTTDPNTSLEVRAPSTRSRKRANLAPTEEGTPEVSTSILPSFIPVQVEAPIAKTAEPVSLPPTATDATPSGDEPHAIRSAPAIRNVRLTQVAEAAGAPVPSVGPKLQFEIDIPASVPSSQTEAVRPNQAGQVRRNIDQSEPTIQAPTSNVVPPEQASGRDVAVVAATPQVTALAGNAAEQPTAWPMSVESLRPDASVAPKEPGIEAQGTRHEATGYAAPKTPITQEQALTAPYASPSEFTKTGPATNSPERSTAEVGQSIPTPVGTSTAKEVDLSSAPAITRSTRGQSVVISTPASVHAQAGPANSVETPRPQAPVVRDQARHMPVEAPSDVLKRGDLANTPAPVTASVSSDSSDELSASIKPTVRPMPFVADPTVEMADEAVTTSASAGADTIRKRQPGLTDDRPLIKNSRPSETATSVPHPLVAVNASTTISPVPATRVDADQSPIDDTPHLIHGPKGSISERPTASNVTPEPAELGPLKFRPTTEVASTAPSPLSANGQPAASRPMPEGHPKDTAIEAQGSMLNDPFSSVRNADPTRLTTQENTQPAQAIVAKPTPEAPASTPAESDIPDSNPGRSQVPGGPSVPSERKSEASVARESVVPTTRDSGPVQAVEASEPDDSKPPIVSPAPRVTTAPKGDQESQTSNVTTTSKTEGEAFVSGRPLETKSGSTDVAGNPVSPRADNDVKAESLESPSRPEPKEVTSPLPVETRVTPTDPTFPQPAPSPVEGPTAEPIGEGKDATDRTARVEATDAAEVEALTTERPSRRVAREGKREVESPGTPQSLSPTHSAATAPVREAAATVTVEGKQPTRVDTHAVLREVANRIELLAATRNRDGVVVHLDPKDLGQITLRVKPESGGGMTAEIGANNEQVRQALERNQPQLLRQVEQRGVHLTQVSISSDTGRSNDGRSQHAPQSNPNPFGQSGHSSSRASQEAPVVPHRRWSSRNTGVDLSI